MSRCSIFLLCKSLNPPIICIENFQIVYYLSGFPICDFIYDVKSPFGQYYITMYKVDLFMNVLKCFTINGEFAYFSIRPYYIAYASTQSLHFF